MSAASSPLPVVLVTGSGRRLGRALAHAFADAGYAVALHAHRSLAGRDHVLASISAQGGSAWPVGGDLTEEAGIRRVVSETMACAGRLDVLVNCAGVFPDTPFEDVTFEEWDRVVNLNLRAAFFLSQMFAPSLRSVRGAIVNVASVGAFEPWVRHIPYNVAKAGLVMLTRALAKALAPDVRVNAVAPGVIVTPGEEGPPSPPAEKIPLHRPGTPAEFSRAVLFLARDATYLTGHVLPVDGGFLGAR
ncbi:MAG: SDR family oxidoreductase [Bacteroidota bacterium]|nr:SDR family oxidoreductase [Bacteroidota bacterium]